MSRFGTGKPVFIGGVGGMNFRPGHWRPDAPGGEVAIPEGPQEPRPDIPVVSTRATEQRMREATARNIAEREAALAPKRYRPAGDA